MGPTKRMAAVLAAICLVGPHLFGCAESRTALAASNLVELSSPRLIELSDMINNDAEQDSDQQYDLRLSQLQPVGLASMSRGPKLSAATAPIGLRAIQRLRPRGELFADRWNAKRDNSRQALNASDELPLERSRRWAPQVAADPVGLPSEHKFIYLVSPMSQLTHLIETERLAQGYRSLLPLSDSYKTALHRVAPSSEAGAQSTPSSYQLDEVCRTRRERVQLTRDETEPISGIVLRRCSGQVELNTCAGMCPSGVQPSIKSSSGFVKRCACCNEAAFRRLSVRLSECSPVGAALDIGQSEQVGQASFMDVEIEEPIDCACRRCEGLI